MGLRVPIPNTKPQKWDEVSTAPNDIPKSKIITPFGDEMREGCMHMTGVFRCGERAIITDQAFSEELWTAAQKDPAIAHYIITSIEKNRQDFIRRNATKLPIP